MSAHLNPPSPPANHVNELRNSRKPDKEPLVEATPRRVRKRIVNLQLDYRTAYTSEGVRAGWVGTLFAPKFGAFDFRHFGLNACNLHLWMEV